MKYIKYKGSKMLMIAMLFIAAFSSCKKDSEFFDIEDPQGIDSKIWSDEGSVDMFLNRTYGLIIPQWPAPGSTSAGIHSTSDESNNANTAFLYGTLVENSVTDLGTGSGIGTNRYFDIRRCNVALEGLDSNSTISDAKKKLLKGQFYFLRAYVYFRMVNLYGGIPLVLNVQYLTENGIPAVPRSKTSECIAAIVRDLDSAAANLPAKYTAATDRGRVTRGAAMAVKGKVLMYWASPQFNPTNIASRWEDAYQANKAAYDQCVTDGYALVSNYANVFLTEDHAEALIVRKYTQTRDYGNNIEALARAASQGTGGSYQPTWNLVQAYTMNNGLPITHSSSGYSNIQFWLNRDPRFDASIAYNGVTWALGTPGRRQWQYTGILDESASTIVTGFYCRRFCNNSLTPAQAIYASGTGGGSGIDWLEMRFAEVILNLAECANETGRLTEAKNMVRLIRQRAGIVAGSFDYGLSIATDIPSMRSLILNENQIEFAMEGKRYHDLRRTRNFSLLSARQSYKIAPKLPYVAGALPNPLVTGRIYLDGVVNGVRARDTLNINNLSTYTSAFTTPGTIATLEGSNVVSVPSKYYFYALPNYFSQSSFVIEQTQGWINGTFDPLQ